MDSVASYLREVAKARGTNLKALSEGMGKSHAYLQQFCQRKTPWNLDPDDLASLAETLQADSEKLIRPSHAIKNDIDSLDRGTTSIPQYDVRVSAGGGAVIESENEIGRWEIPGFLTRSLVVGGTGGLMIVTVVGDSMEPTLKSGDHLLVDRSDKDLSIPGLFALYDGSTAVVKRIEKIPTKPGGRLRLSSDNSLHGAYEVPIEDVNVAGRAVWYGRRL